MDTAYGRIALLRRLLHDNDGPLFDHVGPLLAWLDVAERSDGLAGSADTGILGLELYSECRSDCDIADRDPASWYCDAVSTE